MDAKRQGCDESGVEKRRGGEEERRRGKGGGRGGCEERERQREREREDERKRKRRGDEERRRERKGHGKEEEADQTCMVYSTVDTRVADFAQRARPNSVMTCQRPTDTPPRTHTIRTPKEWRRMLSTLAGVASTDAMRGPSWVVATFR